MASRTERDHQTLMRQALTLAKKSPPKPSNFRVGAVLHATNEEGLVDIMKTPHALYTTMEPCFKRLSGKLPCVERILRQKSWVREVYLGVQEPDNFVGQNPGRAMLESAGIKVEAVPGYEKEILEVATAGHVSDA
ncbi:cytidine and deoxycytidylate deaminase [Metarhizium rileyi]|uniref:Cytidine and deoxycytidylate deaminase n=1 Tax=Metarhizium rileyi (strain RCEF 4871) TaxID=1649241 RepID=A0A167KJ09_METRR|nr:cytidine and deoxycytidylate deaminase [Metarhizium rileyi RCEF 4871]